jgi:predicted dehydrogenase
MAGSRVRVGQIGVGHNGGAFVRAYTAAEAAELVAICDLDEGRAREHAARFGVPHVYTDYREMLAREELDLVSVHTPDHLHVEPAVAALEAGAHLFCEKPLANDMEGCRRIVEAARRAGPQRKMMCGHVLRFNPVFAAVKGLIEEGVLGALFYLEGDYIHDLRFQTGWNLEEEVPMIGGGCHPIDIMQWWAGPVVEVQAYSNHIAFPQMREDDCAVAILRFASGALGRCTAAYGPSGPMAHLYNLAAYGTKGTVVRDQLSLIGLHQFTRLPVEYPPGHPYEPEVEHLARCIQHDVPVRATVVDGARAVAVALAIGQAIRERRAVAVEQL